MAYNVDTFGGDRTIVIEEGTIDTTFDLKLLGKNYAGYGEIQNENFLHLLENFANSTAPPRPINGQIWYDTSTKRIKYYDETINAWRGTGGIDVSITAPASPSEGDLWWKLDTNELFAWNTVKWILIGPSNQFSVLPILRASGTVLNIPLMNGSFPITKRNGTTVNILVK